ncbi:BamA/TamA family outer membrane protein [Novosphingobium sp. SG916]|uniref:autotransporter assembly complex protein TamA n=1 Tax=Novosphingobium sp. SG916 TaxID=2587131 RepID=UPI0017F82510|nr:BamA/TamA family outer membrane protein [Novosphingobium sp. SG916]NMN88346.1 translocation and assembly module TamA [Novosphingobium sp. SG916]
MACRPSPSFLPSLSAPAWRKGFLHSDVFGPSNLARALAALGVGLGAVLGPLPALGQSRDADPALEALIPDSAIDNPQAWARDTDAARATVPDVSTLISPDPLPALPAMPGITLDWPDQADLPAIEPLTPDPDIADAQQQAKAAGAALETDDSAQGVRIANAALVRVADQVVLAFPTDTQIPDRDAIVARFKGLSALATLKDDEDNLAQLTRRAKSDAELLQQVLRVYGYYDPGVTQTIERPATPGTTTPAATAPETASSSAATGAAAPAKAETAEEARARRQANLAKSVVRFDIQPGPQYRFAHIALGDVMAASDSANLRAAFHLNIGDPINSDKILTEKDSLNKELGERGYAFASVGEPDLVIDHEPRTGDLTVPVTTGGKYRFGHVNSNLPAYLSSRHLERIARFRPGDMYQRSDMDDLREGILATSLVSTATVKAREVTPPANGQPGVVDVDVDLTKAPQRMLAGLIGYSSGEGARLEGSWEHRNFFPPEGMIKFRGVLGTQEQLAGFTFRRNNFHERDQVLTADLYAQTIQVRAYDANTISATASLEKQSTLIFQKPWTYSFGIQLIGTQETTSTTPRTTYFIAALPLRGAYDASDSLLDPTRGWRLSLRVSPELSTTDGTKSSYVKTQVDASIYQRISSSVVLAARTRLGAIAGTTLDNIAPSRRFYAGGGASVRGYAYQRVGPLDSAGEPTGGRSLSEFSLEARVKTGLFGGAVGLVPFVDAGTVGPTATPTLSGLRLGAGLGLRYQTNFGPIRIDVGTPINPRPGDSRLGVYIALGQAF